MRGDSRCPRHRRESGRQPCGGGEWNVSFARIRAIIRDAGASSAQSRAQVNDQSRFAESTVAGDVHTP